MSDQVNIAVLQEQVKTLQAQLSTTNTQLKSLQSDRDKALIWGILTLGSAVLALLAWIFKYGLKVLPA